MHLEGADLCNCCIDGWVRKRTHSKRELVGRAQGDERMAVQRSGIRMGRPSCVSDWCSETQGGRSASVSRSVEGGGSKLRPREMLLCDEGCRGFRYFGFRFWPC